MYYPDFFDQVEPFFLHDPLAELLGSFDGGRMEVGYLDVVKAAGHSCPTVAGAYLMTSAALKLLYPETLPVRGEIAVSIKEPLEAKTAGVVANVVSHITGAAQEGGFQGIAGHFSRRGLMRLGADIEGDIRFVRQDNGAAVELSYHPECVPPDPALAELMEKIMQGCASKAEGAEFGKLWQRRVERLLLDPEARDRAIRVVAQRHPSAQ